MGRITVNGSIAQFSAKLSVPEMLWEVSGGRAKAAVSKRIASTVIWTTSAPRSASTIRISATGSHTLRPKRSRMPISASERNTGCFSKRFEKFTGDLKKRVGIDRCHGTWNRYYKSIDHLRTFMRKEYNVSDMPLAELEQSFIEQYHVYLKSDLGLKPTTVSGYLKCLKYVVKIAFNNGWMPRNPFSLYQYGSESGT